MPIYYGTQETAIYKGSKPLVGAHYGGTSLGGGEVALPITAYALTTATEFQIIDGIGAEIQSDSIEGDGGGIQESNTKGLPYGLTASEQLRFADEILKVDGNPITYMRIAWGLYYRGLTADGKRFIERNSNQNATMKAAFDRAGTKLAILHWSPPPFYKKNTVNGTEYRGSITPIPDEVADPEGWNTYLRNLLQGGTLDCPDKTTDLAGYNAWHDDFAANTLWSLEYTHQNVGCVALYSPQNEPTISAKYPTCVWTGEQMYDHLVRMDALISASSILSTYNGQPNTVLYYLDSLSGQQGIGSERARANPTLMSKMYGWAWHRISAMALDKNWARNNRSALVNNRAGTGTASAYIANAFCDEYEFFDEFVDPTNARYLTDAQRFSNIVSNAFRWFVEANAPIHFWIHVGKNSDGPALEKVGRALSAWRPMGVAEPTAYPGLAEGHFTLVKPNAHSNLAMVRHLPAGSRRVGVAVPTYDTDIATLAIRRPDGRHVFGIVNSGNVPRRVTLDTAGRTFDGLRYDAASWGISQGSKSNLLDMTIPPHTAEFWTEQPIAADVTAPMITTSSTQTTVENQSWSVQLESNEAVTWSIVGGDDAAAFTLTGSTLSLAAKDFEIPTDTGANNTYAVTVRATDAAGNWAEKTFTVPVTNADESTLAAYTIDLTAYEVGATFGTIPGVTRFGGTAGAMAVSTAKELNSTDVTTGGTGYGLTAVGKTDQYIRVRNANLVGAGGPVACIWFTDINNWIGVRPKAGSYDLVKKVAGVAAVVATTSGITPTTSDILEVDGVGDTVKLLVNGTERLTASATGVPKTQTPGFISRTTARSPAFGSLIAWGAK